MVDSETYSVLDGFGTDENEIESIERIQHLIFNHSSNPVLNSRILDAIKPILQTKSLSPRLEAKFWILIKSCLNGVRYTAIEELIDLAANSALKRNCCTLALAQSTNLIILHISVPSIVRQQLYVDME